MTDDLVLDIDLTGIEAAQSSLDSFQAILGQELTTAMESALQALEREVSSRTPVNLGKLRDSLNHSVTSPFPNLVGAVGTPLEYGITMEYGRKKGNVPPGGRFPENMPPVAAIAYWLYRKKIVTDRREIRSAAYAVAISIAKKGIEGRHMFRDGLTAATPTIQQIFNNAVGRATAQANE